MTVLLSKAILWLAVLNLAAASQATSASLPTLRHVNYIAIRASRGVDLQFQARCLAQGSHYQDWLTCRLVDPDGFVMASTTVPPGKTGTLAAKVRWEGACAIEARSGWNLAQLCFAKETRYAYRSGLSAPLQTVRAWGPLYFHVPAGTKYFNIFLHASVTREGLHCTIKGPQGSVVREEDGDFDARTKVQILVPKGQDGKAWSIAISRPRQRGLGLDDVAVELGRHLPPFLAPKPQWASAFAGDWRYDPEASAGRTRLQKTEPTLKPFGGKKGPDLDRAYSRDTAGGWKTSLPFTYVLDYGSEHLGNADYVPAVATAPPVLLHLGKDVPFNHGWGPVKALGGENQAHGRGEDIRRLTPEQVRERISGLRQMTDELHAKGVRWVTPYICAMTVNGDHERRSGFWDFYDHWSEYRPLGLAPKPGSDPFDWLQRHPDGSVRLYYRYNYPKEYYPRFENNHRYAACWYASGWQTWLCEVVRFVARCNHDGVFVDNACSQRCQCARCLKAFREYLGRELPAAHLARLLKGVPIDQVTFPEKPGTPLYAEMNRFWCATVHAQLAALKEAGSKELGREFIIFPNGGRPTFIQRALQDTDFVMFEKSHGDYGTHPGLVLRPIFAGIKVRAYNDNIFEHKFVQCLRQRVRPIILSRAGYPRQPPAQKLNADAARLGMAECGAFSGGGGFLLRPDFDVYHDALNEYRRFFETHPQLYAGLDSYAPVALLAFPEQKWVGNGGHMGAVRQLTDSLTQAHVLFDYVSEMRLSETVLKRYPVVVAAELDILSDEQLAILAEYVQAGGHLIRAGSFAGHDEFLAPRQPETNRWASLTHATGAATQTVDRGTVTRCLRTEDVTNALGVDYCVATCPDEKLAPHVKVNAFRSLSGAPGRLVVHLVNYNVPLGVDAPAPTPVSKIDLDLPLPKGTRAVSAKIFAPDEDESVSLNVNCTDGRVRVRISELKIYRVLELQMR